jgi:hypothetical protein
MVFVSYVVIQGIMVFLVGKFPNCMDVFLNDSILYQTISYYRY